MVLKSIAAGCCDHLFLQILLLSRLTAIALLVVYGSYLVFQLGTHHDMFGGSEEDTHPPALTLTAAIIWLSGITVLVAFLSEYLTGSIEEVCKTLRCCSGTKVDLFSVLGGFLSSVCAAGGCCWPGCFDSYHCVQ